jgi:hypothetical protein
LGGHRERPAVRTNRLVLKLDDRSAVSETEAVFRNQLDVNTSEMTMVRAASSSRSKHLYYLVYSSIIDIKSALIKSKINLYKYVAYRVQLFEQLMQALESGGDRN